jgi:hypothetical protein
MDFGILAAAVLACVRGPTVGNGSCTAFCIALGFTGKCVVYTLPNLKVNYKLQPPALLAEYDSLNPALCGQAVVAQGLIAANAREISFPADPPRLIKRGELDSVRIAVQTLTIYGRLSFS